MKAIQKELGDMEDTPNELEDLQNKIEKSGMSKDAREKADSELNKLKMMSPMSAEATVVRNYIDWLVSVPWKKKSKIRRDLAEAEKVLEEDHYGLEKVKERILKGQRKNPGISRGTTTRAKTERPDPLSGRPPGCR
jgi:ATP-dependent Lon protease